MSFAQIYNALLQKTRAAAADAMEYEVADEVKDIMAEQTDAKVYSYSASPMAMAARRIGCGGLGDRGNMLHAVERGPEEVVLTVWDAAPFQGSPADYTTLNDVVETGAAGFNQPGPRPFVDGTQTEAVSSGRAYRALMDGLRRNGM